MSTIKPHGGLLKKGKPDISSTNTNKKEEIVEKQSPSQIAPNKPKKPTKKNPKGAGRKKVYPEGKEPVKVSFSAPPLLFEDVKKAVLFTSGTISTKIVDYLEKFFNDPEGYYKSLEKPFEIYDYSKIKSSGFCVDKTIKDKIAEVCKESGVKQKLLLNSIYYQMMLDIKEELGER